MTVPKAASHGKIQKSLENTYAPVRSLTLMSYSPSISLALSKTHV